MHKHAFVNKSVYFCQKDIEKWIFIPNCKFCKASHIESLKTDHSLSISPSHHPHQIGCHTLISFFPCLSPPLGCEPFYNCSWNHIKPSVYLFVGSLGTWRWCQNCYINLNGTLLLETVTFIHLFREVINGATIKFIQFLTSVSPGGKVIKKEKNSKGWFIFRICLQGYNTLPFICLRIYLLESCSRSVHLVYK